LEAIEVLYREMGEKGETKEDEEREKGKEL
jgi:hypothetical protein